jgi:signal transduction histidine kinase
MVRRRALCQHFLVAAYLRNRQHWVFCVAALAVWLALGWPFLHELVTGTQRRGVPVPPLWLAPFALFGVAVLSSVVLKLPATLRWALLCVQVAAVVAMAFIYPKDLMSLFLVIIAWQVAIATNPVQALGWVAFQTLAIVGTVAQAPNAHLSYIVLLSLVLQLSFVLAAHALRREAEAARALVQANRELQSAQAVIANNARNAERLRISRELHDAWGHELTALGLQLEIASHVADAGRANDHVVQAKGLARDLLAKVRNAVAALRTAEDCDLELTRDAARQDGSGNADLHRSSAQPMANPAVDLRSRLFCVAALAVWLALGWPVLQPLLADTSVRDPLRSALWLVSFTVFGSAVFVAMALRLRPTLQPILLCIQVAAVAVMAFLVSWAMMSAFLIIVAWQIAMRTGPVQALSWVAFQTLIVVGALALAPKPDLCWVIGKSFALQLFFVFTAYALRRQADTARALAETNEELRSAQAIIATTVRDAERLRISRELHDAWGHELTALGLQLEIASHVTEPDKANDHVLQAKGLARNLLAKVRDVVSTLREAERGDLKEALELLARSVPTPAVHVHVDASVQVSPDQAHALVRCAQEALTNAVRHAKADNLWLQVTTDASGVRLVARDDGSVGPAVVTAPGSGLVGMRERLESLGGKLAVRPGDASGFTIDAWLPQGTPRPA